MALWQLQLELIPADAASDNGVLPGGRLTNSQRERTEWWRGQMLPADLLHDLENLLPRGRTWTEKLEVLGDLDCTCVTLFRENSAIVEVHMRLDLRTLEPDMLISLLDFVKKLGCFLVGDDNQVFQPDFDVVVEQIRGSPAYRFVTDPRGFLSGLDQ